MAWNVRTLDVGKGPKITSSCYGFDKAWATAYDNPPLFHPSVLGIMDPMARLQERPAFAVFDGYEDTVDDGSGGDEVPERGCAKKRKLTVEQAKTLEISFESDNKLEAERKQKLAKDLGLHPRQVAVWFQNRRARWKTKRLQQEYVTLKCDYDAVVAESEHLKAEVKRLTKELQIKQGDNNNTVIINSNINRKVDDDEKEDDHNNSNRKDEEINKNNQISNNTNKDHQSNTTTTTNNNNNNSSSNNYSNKVHQETRNYPAPDYKVEEEAIMMQHWETAAMLKAVSKTESSKESLMSTANSDQSSDLNIQSEPYLGIFTCTDQDELWVFNSF